MNNIDCKNATADIKDDKVQGLFLRVTSTKKAFYLRYRFEGVQRCPKIGDFPTINVAQARDTARRWHGQVAQGVDPSAKRQEARRDPTVSDLCDRYLKEHATKKAASHKYDNGRYVDRFVKPKLGSLKVSRVKNADIEALHASLSATPTQANRVLALLSKMFALAEKWEYRPQHTNPCAHVDRFPEAKRKRYATEKELAKVFELLQKYREQYPRPVTFLWLEIYTGARPKELAGAMPDHYSDGKIDLPQHKTAWAGVEKTIYLPPQAVDILDAFLKEHPKSRSGTLLGIKSPRKLWDKIRAEAGCPDLRMYDLRHTFASVGVSHGMSLDTFRGLLGHTSAQTTTRYAHLVDSAARNSVAQAADAIDAFAKKGP